MSATVTQHPTNYSIYAANTVPNIVMTTNEIITAELSVSNNVLFVANYCRDINNQVVVDFRLLYKNYLQSSMNGSGVINQNTAHKLFTIRLSGSLTQNIATYNFTVCNAVFVANETFSVFIANNFLTNQPKEKITTYVSPEWLTYYDTDGNWNVIARFYRKSGGHKDVTIQTDASAGMYSIDVSYDRIIKLVDDLPWRLDGYWDIILRDGHNFEKTRQRYINSTTTGQEKYFLFVNALGGIDTLICRGENTLVPNTSHKTARFGQTYKSLDNTDDTKVWSQNSGQLPWKWREWLHEFTSAKEAHAILENEVYVPIVITASEISIADGGELANCSFDYMYAQTAYVSHEEGSDDLHLSTAQQAVELQNLATSTTLHFTFDEGLGCYTTEEITVTADKIYVEWDRVDEGKSEVFIDDEQVGIIDFVEDDCPFVFATNSQRQVTISFTSEQLFVDTLKTSYYPIN